MSSTGVRFPRLVTVAALAGAAALFLVPSAGASTAGTCRAQLVVFEDGTWTGGRISANGHKLADRWQVVAPELQGRVTPDAWGRPSFGVPFPVVAEGVPCKVFV